MYQVTANRHEIYIAARITGQYHIDTTTYLLYNDTPIFKGRYAKPFLLTKGR